MENGLRRYISNAPEWRGMPPAAHSFLSCQKRMGRKEALENEIALTRRKNLSLHFACYRYSVRSQNALRAALESGFPNARYTMRVVLFAPVEYLTYGIRRVCDFLRLVGADAHIGPIKITNSPNITVKQHILTGRCGHRPLQTYNFDSDTNTSAISDIRRGDGSKEEESLLFWSF